MTQTIDRIATPSTPTVPETLEETRLYREASEEQRAVLLEELNTLDEGELVHHLATLEQFPGTVAEYLTPLTEQPAAEGASDPTPDPVQQQAAAVAAQVQQTVQAAAPTEADEQAARKEAHQTLQALVRAYAKGEKAYRDGLLESGRLCQVYVAKRLALGDKRAPAVQAIEGQLAAYASDSVDVNRLIRCWASWHLLAETAGLDKDAKSVPYGCYRDAWSLLVERADANTASERYVLLPGLEGECQAAFKAAVEGGLSKAACIDAAKTLQHKQLALAADAKRAAEALAAEQKAAADKAAAQALAATRAAAAAAQKAADDAQQAAAEAAAEQDPAAKLAAEKAAAEAKAAAEQAKRDAAAKAKAEQDARFAAEQKARDEARARSEAAEASRKQAEAEARARSAASRKAAKQGQTGTAAVKTPDMANGKAPAVESRAGQNLLVSMSGSVRAATAEDAGEMLADVIRQAAGKDGETNDPCAVVYELLASLLDTPPAGIKPDGIAAAIFQALADATLPAGSPEAEAVKAASSALERGRKPASPSPADVANAIHASEAKAAVKQPATAA